MKDGKFKLFYEKNFNMFGCRIIQERERNYYDNYYVMELAFLSNLFEKKKQKMNKAFLFLTTRVLFDDSSYPWSCRFGSVICRLVFGGSFESFQKFHSEND